VPLHVWLPLAHPAAPMPASAVLSGALVKAGVIGFLRFLPLDPALAGWGEGLAALGFGTALYAVGVGITQANPKTVLAYSSVSQMGGVVAILGMALARGDGAGVSAASFTAAHHVLVKGALFLAVGVAAVTGARRRWIVWAPALVLSLSLGGFPLTGGGLAKLAAKASMGEGVAAMLAALSAAGTTLLMLHFVSRLGRIPADEPEACAPAGLLVPWLALAAAAIAVPWALSATVVGVTGTDVVQPKALGDALWPIGVGVVLAVLLGRFASRMPCVPEGDLIVLAAPAARRAGGWADALERVDRSLREWPVAGVSLLALAILLVAILARSGAGG
jgi:formate hydrogenlyase subunit 3/multisubunit Na+/H+ antiporter MnhD subunit